ncbi:hypothetical protein [Rhodovulum sulfidophilum]|nr:hypothetical protein [Rhodovulum sulfidophilum]MBL3553186.1 hypothetical protein [Rhodovulum sulfidophilum]
MACKPNSFTQADVARVLKACCGAEIPMGWGEIDPRTGKIAVIALDLGEA